MKIGVAKDVKLKNEREKSGNGFTVFFSLSLFYFIFLIFLLNQGNYKGQYQNEQQGQRHQPKSKKTNKRKPKKTKVLFEVTSLDGVLPYRFQNPNFK